ncbi:MAG: hypothetical protein CVV29_10810 [Methanobacteriales archaeon HGW-Methanobacteriales-2]|nr:MAG: hypothetical protein CVV29_10810 [Methanobacteriales archaeon HGW-Methanobacteriales-2]
MRGIQLKKKTFARKNELLEAALDEFTLKNYENASLNTIIKNAGISKGTFYYHFQDKESLYLFLLETANKAKWKFINNHRKEIPRGQKANDIFEEFKIQAQIGMEFASSFPQYHRLSMMFVRERGNKIYNNAKSKLNFSTQSMMGEVVKKARENGELNPRFSEDFTMKVLTHLLMNFDDIFHEEEDFHLNMMVENLNNYVEFMKNGLGK